jgi:PhnB protein
MRFRFQLPDYPILAITNPLCPQFLCVEVLFSRFPQPIQPSNFRERVEWWGCHPAGNVDHGQFCPAIKTKEQIMATTVNPIPEGFHTVTPAIVVRDAAKAIDFYKKALGAQELMRMPGPDGKIMHAEIKIGDSIIFISDENPQMAHVKSPQTLGGCTGTLNVYVPNVDTTFKQALAAGGKESMPVADQFWGDRYGSFIDPFGFSWGVATHKEDVSAQDMPKRAQEFFANMAQRKSA